MSTHGVKVVRATAGPASGIHADGAQGLTESPLLDIAEGPGNFDVRYIRLQPGGVSSDHAHRHEQANYILAGRGRVAIDGELQDVAAHDFVFTPGDVRHSFVNDGDEELVLLCVRGPRAV